MTEHRTPDAPLEDRIKSAGTVEELRKCFKEAGTTGVLENSVVLDSGEKITIRDWLFRRSDELGTPKSTGDSQGDPGTDSGAE